MSRSWPLDEECCTGMDVPIDPWTAEDVAFWTATPTYQPWKDVAALFGAEMERTSAAARALGANLTEKG